MLTTCLMKTSAKVTVIHKTSMIIGHFISVVTHKNWVKYGLHRWPLIQIQLN